MRLYAAWLALPLALALWPPPLAAQEAEDPPAYRQTIADAVREFSAGHWEEALALFKRAHEIEPNARTLRGMGMASYELRKYVESMSELTASLHDARKPLDPDMREQVQSLIDKARGFVGRVRLVVDPKDAEVLIDGQPPAPRPDGSLVLDAGTHVVSATANGYKPTSMRVTVEGGSDQTLQLPLEPLLPLTASVPAIGSEPEGQNPQPSAGSLPQQPAAQAPAAHVRLSSRSSSYQTFGWVALAGAVGLGAAAGASWAIGSSKYSDLRDSCAPTCSDAEITDSGVATTDTLSTVFLVAAIASGAGAGVLFALSAGHSSERRVGMGVSPTGVALTGAF